MTIRPTDSAPRIIYIGDAPIGVRGATGQTLQAMYGAVDDDRLLQLAAHLAPGGSRGTVVVVPPSATPLRSVLLFGLRAIRTLVPARAPIEAHDGLNASVVRQGLTARQRVRHSLRALSEIAPVRLPRALRRTIDEFRPDVVHSLLGSVRSMHLANAISRRWQVPIAAHFMDDWPPTMYRNGELLGAARLAAMRALRMTLARSPLLLTIGKAMKDEYEVRYGRPCIAVGYGVDLAEFSGDVVASNPVAQHSLVYAGGLHLGRSEVLVRIARHLQDSGSAWRVIVYAPPGDATRLLPDILPVSMEVRAELPGPDVPPALVRADALLFVESNDPHIAAFTRLSVSTKVPQYLAARRPIATIGPEGQASIAELRTSARHVCLLPTLDDSTLRELDQFLEDSRRFGLIDQDLPDRFDRATVQQTFARAIEHVARARRRGRS